MVCKVVLFSLLRVLTLTRAACHRCESSIHPYSFRLYIQLVTLSLTRRCLMKGQTKQTHVCAGCWLDLPTDCQCPECRHKGQPRAQWEDNQCTCEGLYRIFWFLFTISQRHRSGMDCPKMSLQHHHQRQR